MKATNNHKWSLWCLVLGHYYSGQASYYEREWESGVIETLIVTTCRRCLKVSCAVDGYSFYWQGSDKITFENCWAYDVRPTQKEGKGRA